MSQASPVLWMEFFGVNKGAHPMFIYWPLEIDNKHKKYDNILLTDKEINIGNIYCT